MIARKKACFDLATEGRPSFTWSSPEVQTAFESYWNTNPGYLSAKHSICEFSHWQPVNKQDLPMFERLGYLEGAPLDLDNFVQGGKIHPIVQEWSWIVDPELDGHEVYVAMKPALRLVSEFLYSKEFYHWWFKVRCGRISHTTPRVLILDAEDSRDAHQLVKDSLLELAHCIRFTWGEEDVMDADGLTISTIPNLISLLLNKPYEKTDRKPNPTIVLSIAHYNRLKTLAALTPGENLRFQFCLAKLILHELGHAFFAYWKQPWSETKIHQCDLMAEAGFSLEVALFGTILQCDGINNTNNQSYVSPMMAIRLQDQLPVTTPMMAFVPMEWVQGWFKIETWANISEKKALGNLQVPTMDGIPRLFQVLRWDGKSKTRWSLEYNLTDDEARAVSLSTKESPGARKAREYGSGAKWYGKIWPKDAMKALQVKKLDIDYIRADVAYAHLFPDYDGPAWIDSVEGWSFGRFVRSPHVRLMRFLGRD
ncbi:hypothetical protein K504DRAFT_451472 [Pleomassaria siparia CBS 279.74]|uniref:Uncharacterized protein n=1 Tax=Pleomassaria siparia CBS 279.74 TaxID=1314801 RepID=A0A6G1JST8_9PLEO|nr:hypothetical protein K504DRAFT_451472 [Pleomassaria siparia CBS 279.74]